MTTSITGPILDEWGHGLADGVTATVTYEGTIAATDIRKADT